MRSGRGATGLREWGTPVYYEGCWGYIEKVLALDGAFDAFSGVQSSE